MSGVVAALVTLASLGYLAIRAVIRLRRANRLANGIYDQELGRPPLKRTEVAKLRGIIDRQNRDQP